jgi:DNA-binding NtrC family response regulator
MRLAACARQTVITEEDLFDDLPAATRSDPPSTNKQPASKPQSLKTAIEELERRMIREAIESTRNNQQQAARLLGLSRQGLINKLKRYSLGG